jgi:anthranilate phosphoribosyltransferase
MDTIQPRSLGLNPARNSELSAGSTQNSKLRAQNILTGKEKGPARDTIVLNAAYGLLICKKAKTVREGIALAQKSIDSGNALRALQQLKAFSH